MSVINEQDNITITSTSLTEPPPNLSIKTLTFEEAKQVNNIYRGNGLICQQKMCESLTGCSSPFGCPNHPDWNKIQTFCGPIGTGAINMDGALWRLQAKPSRVNNPNPYNVRGMY